MAKKKEDPKVEEKEAPKEVKPKVEAEKYDTNLLGERLYE